MTHYVNPLSTELNPICHLLALAVAHHILHVSRVRVNVNSLLSVRQAFLLFSAVCTFTAGLYRTYSSLHPLPRQK